MSKHVFLLLILLLPLRIFSQTKYEIEDFSPDFYAIVEIDSDENEVFKPGRIIVYATKNNKKLFEVESEELAFDLNDGKVKANVKQLPYGEQSVLIYEDFNFDGLKDLAIQDGQNSCYHGPSYQIYLRNGSGFSHNSSFTELAQMYCGMFHVDHDNQKIYTMTKSGCCWHQYSEFEVNNNEPVPVKVVEEGLHANGYMMEIHTKTREGDRMKETNEYFLYQLSDNDILFYFELEKNGKRVYLFTSNDELNYMFTTKDDKIEFDYQMMCKNPSFQFITTKEKKYLKFINPGAEYQVYEKRNPQGTVEYGTIVITNGKTYTNKANLKSIKGNFSSIEKLLNR